MTDMERANYLEPPLEPDVHLGGFERIDMPIDWLGEEWALGLSAAALGTLFRLYGVSLRQSPAGSLPADPVCVSVLVPGEVPTGALAEVLELWPVHADGRRYWSRVIPFIEDAWSRRKGKTSRDTQRKRRERLRNQLIKCGLTDVGAANHDVQAAVLAEMFDGDRLTFDAVFNAATRAGVIGPVRPLRSDTSGQSRDCPEVSGGQSADSCWTVAGQSRDRRGTVVGQYPDSPHVSDMSFSTRYGVEI